MGVNRGGTVGGTGLSKIKTSTTSSKSSTSSTSLTTSSNCNTDFCSSAERLTAHLSSEMKRLMSLALKASLPELNPQRIPGCFEFYGFDFMIDHTFRPWLIEVNTNPCLELCNAHLANIIPTLIESGINRVVFGSFAGPSDSASGQTSIGTSSTHESRWEKLNLC